MNKEIIKKFENLIDDIVEEIETLPIESSCTHYLARVQDVVEKGLSKYKDIYNQGGIFKSLD